MKNERTISEQIIAYLDRHPDAQDTAQGVAEWWLLSPDASRSLAEVEAALRLLVAEQRVRAKHGADGTIYYEARSESDKADKSG